MLKFLIILFLVPSVHAFELVLADADVNTVLTLKSISRALSRDSQSQLPERLTAKVGMIRDLPPVASCEQYDEKSYINSELEINPRVIDLMNSVEFNQVLNGCSHRLALFLALQRVLPNYFTGKKREAIKRSFTIEQISLATKMIDEILNSTHDVLSSKRPEFSIYPINSDEYFLVSNFKLGRVVGKHRYRIGINPKVFDLGISTDALKAILAHELQHTEDYATGSFFGRVVPIGARLLIKKHRYRYERQTDLKTVLKGYGLGLIAYKEWQYRLLTPEALKIKKENYLTPAEISLIMQHLPEREEVIKKALRGRAPKNLAEWHEYLDQ